MSTSKKFMVAILCVVFFIIGIVGGFIGITIYEKSKLSSDKIVLGDLSIHFLELGNGYTGDSIYINAGDTDIIVDGGSKTNSSKTITNYIDKYVTDKVIEYAIVTHADRDHIACFAGDGTNESLFDHYEVKTIIDFARTNKTSDVYKRYVQKRDEEVSNGAIHYTALECFKELNGAKRSYEISDGINLNILYNYYYEYDSNDENNYSVCFQIEQGDNKFLFTGDLEKSGEEKLVEFNSLSKVKLFKAGHHGSRTSSNDVLLDVIQPEICVATCVAGSVEYTDNLERTFPTQDFINRISKWTDKVYVPTRGFIEVKEVNTDGTINYKDVGYESLNGNIVVSANRVGVKVECSNNNTLLKDTSWFKEYRVCPQNWVA